MDEPHFCPTLCYIMSHKYSYSLKLHNYFLVPAFDIILLTLPVEEFERSWEQNEELGLNDIDTSPADAAYNSTSDVK